MTHPCSLKRVLLVEDEALIAPSLDGYLRDAGLDTRSPAHIPSVLALAATAGGVNPFSLMMKATLEETWTGVLSRSAG